MKKNKMKPVKCLLIIFVLNIFAVQYNFPHYKAKYHVIIDTDGGVDDFRAICMILADPEIEVIAITTTDGVLIPEETRKRLVVLLKRFGHEGIPVAPGRSFLDDPPECRSFASGLSWGKNESTVTTNGLTAVELINQAVELEEMPVDYLALGPLTNIAEALNNNSELLDEFRKIYWYDEGYSGHGLNYNLNPAAAERIISSSMKMDIISSGPASFKMNETFVSALDTVYSDYAKAILDLYRKDKQKLLEHFMGLSFADDCIPIYLAYPEHFYKNEVKTEAGITEIRPIPETDLQPLMLSLLDNDKEDKSILFKTFPVYPGLFEDDVSPSVEEIIRRHGLKEWRVVVLTNEFHEHLGIYSIVGAKMGLRAREYFRVGIDELKIKSYAGYTTPVSCMNDGLQASTGATLGHGTISVDASDPLPAAEFSFKNKTIRIDVKQDIKVRIRKDVQNAVALYGTDTPEYWEAIRELAVKYWLELDRREIFEIRVV
jgi:pyrimidine-specific ribonucleoside hydrolase